MSSEVTSIEEKSNNSKNIITYSAILITFLIALWLSFQSEGPSKMPKVSLMNLHLLPGLMMAKII